MSALLWNINSSDLSHFGTYANTVSNLGQATTHKSVTVSSNDIFHGSTYIKIQSYFGANNALKSLAVAVDALTDRTIIGSASAYTIY